MSNLLQAPIHVFIQDKCSKGFRTGHVTEKAAVSCCCSVGVRSGAVGETEVVEVGWVHTEGGKKMFAREFGRVCKTLAFGTREKSDVSERISEEPSSNDLGTEGCELKKCSEIVGPPSKIQPRFLSNS